MVTVCMLNLKTSTHSDSSLPPPLPEYCPPGRTRDAYSGKSDYSKGKQLQILKLAQSDCPTVKLSVNKPHSCAQSSQKAF